MRIRDWSSDVVSSDLLDRARDRADLDEADAEQPEIGVDARRIGFRGERWIHEPAAVGGKADEYRGEEAQPPDRISPKGISRERSEEHTSELQSLLRFSYAVFRVKNEKHHLGQELHPVRRADRIAGDHIQQYLQPPTTLRRNPADCGIPGE